MVVLTVSLIAQGQQPSGRSQHSVAQVGKYMILFGGYNSRSVFSDVYVLDCESFKWKHIETSGARIPDYIDRLEPVPFRVFPSRREGGIVGTCFVTLGGIAGKLPLGTMLEFVVNYKN